MFFSLVSNSTCLFVKSFSFKGIPNSLLLKSKINLKKKIDLSYKLYKITMIKSFQMLEINHILLYFLDDTHSLVDSV